MSSLIETTLFGTVDYVADAIREIRKMSKRVEPNQGKLCVRFSGGKDSIVLKRLCELAGVPCETRFSRTSVDPPEVLDFIRKYHKDVISYSCKRICDLTEADCNDAEIFSYAGKQI